MTHDPVSCTPGIPQTFTLFLMIGIFDSGIGGITLARRVEQLLPRYPVLYLGDTARTPYGTKSAKTITEYSVENTRYLIDQGATIIVIACNTAASVATERLRREFNVPIIEVITPAVDEALKLSKTDRIGVIGTTATIDSGTYNAAINAKNPACKVFTKSCPLLVPLVEEGWAAKRETKMILRRYLYPLKNQQLDTLILGCTHYSLLKHLIQTRIGRRVTLIDPSEATAAFLKLYLTENSTVQAKQGHEPRYNKYFATDITAKTTSIAQDFLGRQIDLLPLQ